MSRSDPHETISVPADPLLKLQRRTWHVMLVGGTLVALATTYCLWPVSIDPLPPGPHTFVQPDASTGPAAPVPLDLAAFDAPVWLAPPAPPVEVAAKPAPPPPPPPLKLELLGILREGDSFRAVVYDPDTDKVAVLSAGDTLAGRTVNKITADTVAIKDGTGTRTLTLKQAAAGGDG